VALIRGNTIAKFVNDVLKFYSNPPTSYYLYTDNQVAEHIATQPNMNEHSRSIDTRHHAIRQDYIDGHMRIGGVASADNRSDILKKYLQPPLHEKHAHFHITQEKRPPKQTLTNCALRASLQTSPQPNVLAKASCTKCAKPKSLHCGRNTSAKNCSLQSTTQPNDNDKNNVKDFGMQYTPLDNKTHTSKSNPKQHLPTPDVRCTVMMRSILKRLAAHPIHGESNTHLRHNQRR
jgi:hypothetical protein